MSDKAAIFDLHGTLTKVFSFRRHNAMLPDMAAALGVPPDDFLPAWKATFPQRLVGSHATIEQSLERVCEALGRQPDPDRVAAAALVRYEHTHTQLVPRDDAVPALSVLRDAGILTGLITDCTPDVVRLWDSTPFAPLIDAPIFSCTAGVAKPDPDIYQAACAALAVRPGDCLFVGDGGSNELSGAAAFGMRPIRLRVQYEDTYANVDYPSDAWDWTGETVDSLADLPRYLS
jgi:putative hydrolase of the HAD superfamily